MNKIPQSVDDLRERLKEHLHFLKSSGKAFDSGYQGEARRLAASARVLLKESRTCVSLLNQLGLKDGKFFYSANHPYDPKNLITHTGLLSIEFSATGHRYKIKGIGSKSGRNEFLDFEEWWEETILYDGVHKFSRSSIVGYLSEQDGGVHVDKALNEEWVSLSRRNSIGWKSEQPGLPAVDLGGVELFSMRQISEELVYSIESTQSKC